MHEVMHYLTRTLLGLCPLSLFQIPEWMRDGRNGEVRRN